jgi:hypothetical protein
MKDELELAYIQSLRTLEAENQELKDDLSVTLAEALEDRRQLRILRGRAKRAVDKLRGAGGIDFAASQALLHLAEALDEETQNE